MRGSIADPAILDRLADDFDLAFHLATFHGNQNSMADPLADHRNNLETTLRLYQRLSGFERLQKVVYASAGCTMARKVYGAAEPTKEDDPISLDLDSPYQISKIVGEMYGNYFHERAGLPVVHARFQNVYGPGEILGAGRWRGTAATVWRNVTPTFVYRAITGLPLILENRGKSSRDFIYVDDIVDGLLRCATRGEPGEAYNLASGVETTHPRAGRGDQRPPAGTGTDRAGAPSDLGPFRKSAGQHGQGGAGARIPRAGSAGPRASVGPCAGPRRTCR